MRTEPSGEFVVALSGPFGAVHRAYSGLLAASKLPASPHFNAKLQVRLRFRVEADDTSAPASLVAAHTALTCGFSCDF